MRKLWVIALLLGVAGMACAGDEPTPAQIDAWERQLSSYATKEDARQAARRAIAALKPPAAAAAVALRLLSGASVVGRIEGARVARELGTAAPLLIPHLLMNLRDAQAGVRAAAAEALGAVSSRSNRARVLDRLGHALDDAQAPVRASAVIGLAALNGLSDDHVLDRLLDPKQGYATVVAILRRDAQVAATVDALLRVSSRNLREIVLRTMVMDIDERKQAAPLERWKGLAAERLREDWSGAVRLMAVRVLGRTAYHGADVAQAILPGMRDADRVVRAQAYYMAEASHAGVATILMADLKGTDARFRASAAWLLRTAPKDWPGLTQALRSMVTKGAPSEARQAAAALLDRGQLDERLVQHLATFVSECGVPQPYPEPEGLQDLGVGGGRKRFEDERPPEFQPSAAWNAGRLEAAGKRAVAPMVAALRAAKKDDRLTWIHALAITGSDGVAALLAERERLDEFERLIVAVVRAHAGSTDEALIAELIEVVSTSPSPDLEEHIIGGGDTPLRRGGLALDALEAIGKPALAALKKAAADAEKADVFKDLLRKLGG